MIGPVNAIPLFTVSLGAAAARNPVPGGIAPVAGGDGADAGAQTSTDSGSFGTTAQNATVLGQQALAAGATQNDSPTSAASQQAEADQVVTMPATPLAHILLQLRAVASAQRSTLHPGRVAAEHRP